MASLKAIRNWIVKRMSTENGKNLLVFLVFLCVSAIFWLVLTLNDEYQRDISIPVEITNVPDSVMLLSAPPRTINVSVRDKGNVLAKYQWGEIPPIKINYRNFIADNNKLVVSQGQINNLLHSYFGANSHILNTKPDSIALTYTSRPGVKIKVTVDGYIDTSASPGYVITHDPYCVPDSVMLYSVESVAGKIMSLSIENLSFTNLTDSITVNATVNVPDGMRAVPDVVKLVVPVERLERKTRTVPVTVNNAPKGQDVTVTPSEVMVVYLVPASKRDNDNYPIYVVADYLQRNTETEEAKIPLAISQLPDFYTAPQIFRVDNPEMRIDSIEYVLEDIEP